MDITAIWTQLEVNRIHTSLQSPIGNKVKEFCRQRKTVLGGSPGLMVMGDDLCSRGQGFESQQCELDGNDIFHIDSL